MVIEEKTLKRLNSPAELEMLRQELSSRREIAKAHALRE